MYIQSETGATQCESPRSACCLHTRLRKVLSAFVSGVLFSYSQVKFSPPIAAHLFFAHLHSSYVFFFPGVVQVEFIEQPFELAAQPVMQWTTLPMFRKVGIIVAQEFMQTYSTKTCVLCVAVPVRPSCVRLQTMLTPGNMRWNLSEKGRFPIFGS